MYGMGGGGGGGNWGGQWGNNNSGQSQNNPRMQMQAQVIKQLTQINIKFIMFFYILPYVFEILYIVYG